MLRLLLRRAPWSTPYCCAVFCARLAAAPSCALLLRRGAPCLLLRRGAAPCCRAVVCALLLRRGLRLAAALCCALLLRRGAPCCCAVLRPAVAPWCTLQQQTEDASQ
jgi:hypothetical protein